MITGDYKLAFYKAIRTQLVILLPQAGILAGNWRESVVTPVVNLKNAIKCEEYRTINMLRTCEKIVNDQLEEYFEKHSLLSKYQSGFRKRYSCETAISYVDGNL